MPKPLWECPGCGKTVRSDPLGNDDWGGVDTVIGPDCEECDEYMEYVDETQEKLEKAAACSQHKPLVDNESLRECVVLNIIDPLKVEIERLQALLAPIGKLRGMFTSWKVPDLPRVYVGPMRELFAKGRRNRGEAMNYVEYLLDLAQLMVADGLSEEAKKIRQAAREIERLQGELAGADNTIRAGVMIMEGDTKEIERLQQEINELEERFDNNWDDI